MKDIHAVCKKMTRNGPEIVILKYGSIFNASDVSLYLDTLLITLVQTFTISYIEHSMYHQKHCLIKTQGWMHTVAQQTITVMGFLS